ncbi:recombinase RecT [Actinomadura sp. LOL_016]|uniref:recombinase RecT n=1 Tax=unclassified Actinomadura TaxID=2626254 RepID=UPI003A812E9C
MGRDLAQRAAAKRNSQTDGQDDAERNGKKTLNRQIQSMEKQFQLAMPKGAEATQLIRDAMTCISGTPRLAECDSQTVLGGLMTCAQLGLRPGVAGLGHAWLIPMWDKNLKGMAATLIIGYRGYAELAYRHPKVEGIASRVVYEKDEFEIEFGLQDGHLIDRLVHRPYTDGRRGGPRSFYAVARLSGGGIMTEPWSLEEMEDHRDKYAMAKKDGFVLGPWRDNFVEMGRKTMIRNPLMKMMPISTELAAASVVDEGIRFNTDPDADPAAVTERPEPDEPNAIPGELVDGSATGNNEHPEGGAS